MSVPQTATEAPPYAMATIRRRVEWGDTDASGHHHNSAMLRRVEAREAVLFHDLGLDGYFPSAPRVHRRSTSHPDCHSARTSRRLSPSARSVARR